MEEIITSFQQEDFEVGLHVWENYVTLPNRPPPFEAVAAIAADVPEVIEDYPTDLRGRSCLVLGLLGDGRLVHVVVGYERQPMKLITTYYPDPADWIDGRFRVEVQE